MKKQIKKSAEPLKPTVVGTGLVALDVVVSGDDVKYFAGGTCGNVLTCLSYLGWDAKPVARLKNDSLAKWLIDDLSKWNVDTSHLTTTDDGSTPVIIQRIKTDSKGNPTHSFSLRCPCCGSYLPGYKSILGAAADEMSDGLSQHQVFFFDRVSRGTLNLAQACAERGALVVFEPSGIGEPRLFREAWSIAHVVKYSNDRLRDIADIDLKSVRNDLLMEIETMGASGLRFRCRLPRAESKGWRKLKVVTAAAIRDAAGSGDWCTAGFIHKLARGGLTGFRNATSDRLTEALRYGQALAAWNCSYEGARGGMYQITKPQFDRSIQQFLAGKTIHPIENESQAGGETISKVCSTCESAAAMEQSRKSSEKPRYRLA